ncbi:HEPACAM family member 2 [Labeo rohita]|uniref:HEPACAM family member 2 n=1 Tax=Labeo rohita TaxID=84645 RepID=A0ABQ8M2P5_LABRO|nr:HEPACAM family member 2 [Labeo rohita]
MVQDTSKYDLMLIKRINNTQDDPVCRVKYGRMKECDLYNNRAEVTVINGTLIINHVIRADLGNYRLRLSHSDGTETSRDLQVIVEGLDRFCRFDQSDPCYAALGHKLNLLMVLDTSEYDLMLIKRTNDTQDDPVCRVKYGRMKECDLYNNRAEVTVIDGSLIINHVIRADSGNYTLRLSHSDGTETSRDLQVIVEVSVSCFFNQRSVSCSSEGDQIIYNWTLNGEILKQGLMDGNSRIDLDEGTDGNISCSMKNHISHAQKTISVEPCPGLDRFCRFDQSDLCYAALGHKLNLLMVLDTSEYDLQIIKRIYNTQDDPLCRVKYGRMKECDLYNNRAEVTVIDGTLIINHVTRADSGNYTLRLSHSDGTETSRDLQVIVEAPIGSVEVSISCSSNQRSVSCSSDGDQITYNWTLNGKIVEQGPMVRNTTIQLDEGTDGNISCSVKNHVSQAQKTIRVEPCPGATTAPVTSSLTSTSTQTSQYSTSFSSAGINLILTPSPIVFLHRYLMESDLGLDRFCWFNQSDPCYAALGHKLNLLMVLDARKYDLKIQKRISTDNGAVCRVKYGRIRECDLYNNRPEVTIVNGMLIIYSVSTADSGNYRLTLSYHTQATETSRDLQVFVEALGHKLSLMMVRDTSKYDLMLRKRINNPQNNSVCGVKNGRMRDCDLYNNRPEVTVINGTLIINCVIRADSGNYTLDFTDSWVLEGLQVIVEAPIGLVEVSIICSSSEVMRASCSSEGDQLLYSWTLNGDPLMDGISSIELNEGTDGNISCSVKNHVSHGQKTIRVKPCLGLDRFCRFDQSDPCYAALGHKLNLLMVLDTSEYDLQIIKRIYNTQDDPLCRVKYGRMKECDLYNNRAEVTVINGTVIINHVIRADSGNYTLRLIHSDGTETSRDLQVIVEAPIGPVNVSISFSSNQTSVSCSSEGDHIIYNWTLNGIILEQGPMVRNTTIQLNETSAIGNISCSVKNNVSYGEKTISVKPCPEPTTAPVTSSLTSTVTSTVSSTIQTSDYITSFSSAGLDRFCRFDQSDPCYAALGDKLNLLMVLDTSEYDLQIIKRIYNTQDDPVCRVKYGRMKECDLYNNRAEVTVINGTVIINHVIRADSGNYTLRLIHSGGTETSRDLQVFVEAPIGSVNVSISCSSNQSSVSCSSEGDQIIYKWILNGILLEQGPMVRNTTIQLNETSAIGNISCSVKNNVSYGEKTISVKPCPEPTTAPVTSSLTSTVTSTKQMSDYGTSFSSAVFVLVWCFQLMVLLGLLGGFHIYMRHTSVVRCFLMCQSSVSLAVKTLDERQNTDGQKSRRSEAASHSSAGFGLFWKLDFREMMLIFGLMLLLQTADGLDRFCRFDQSDPCYAALGHKLNVLMVLNTSEYDMKIQKRINYNKTTDPVCRVKYGRIKKNECDLYSNRSEVTVINGTLIINRVIRADSGNYTVTLYHSDGTDTSTHLEDLEVNVEAPIGSVEVSIICSSSGVMRASCSSEGDQLLYNWTLNGDSLMDGNSSIDLNEGTDGNITCSVKNHVSHGQKTINVKPCSGPTTASPVRKDSEHGMSFSKAALHISLIVLGCIALILILLFITVCHIYKKKQVKSTPATAGNAEIIYADISHEKTSKKGKQCSCSSQALPDADVEYSALKPQKKRKEKKQEEVQYGEVRFIQNRSNAHQRPQEECVYSQVHGL